MEWYDGFMGGQADSKVDDNSSVDETMVDAQDTISCQSNDMDFDSGDLMHHNQEAVNCLPSQTTTPKPLPSNALPETDAQGSQLQYPALGALGLAPSLAQSDRDSAVEHGNTKPGAFVTDAADNLINAMTKMMNSRGRRTSQLSDEGIDVEPENTQLSQPQRQMLQKVLSMALERLSDDVPIVPEPVDEKQDWFQCDICSKRTRLRCEMKYVLYRPAMKVQFIGPILTRNY